MPEMRSRSASDSASSRQDVSTAGRGVVSFEAPLLTWIAEKGTESFELRNCWREVGHTAQVLRQSTPFGMRDINDLVDAVLQLSFLGLVSYDWKGQTVKVNLPLVREILEIGE